MLIAFPVKEDKGEDSEIFGHFAVAPCFVLYNTDAGSFSSFTNEDGEAAGGGSRNVSDKLAELGVEIVVAGGIGLGAIKRLNENGMKVYGSLSGMVKYELKLLESGKLSQMQSGNCDGAYRK